MAHRSERYRVTGDYRRLIAKKVLGFKDIDSVSKNQVKNLDARIRELERWCSEEIDRHRKNPHIEQPYKISNFNARVQ